MGEGYPRQRFGGVPTGHLDLADYFADFYPSDHLPTTGFALAVWLCELDLDEQIVLAGFSARRSERWKIFHGHDWTFEQVVQRLLVRSSRLTIASAPTPHAYAALAKRFPDMSAADISLAAAEILSERLESANTEIDRLIWVTKVNQSIQNFIRGLKPIETFIRRLKKKERQTKSSGSYKSSWPSDAARSLASPIALNTLLDVSIEWPGGGT